MHTIAQAALTIFTAGLGRPRPSLSIKVLLALKGGLRALWCAPDVEMGIADALSKLWREPSVLSRAKGPCPVLSVLSRTKGPCPVLSVLCRVAAGGDVFPVLCCAAADRDVLSLLWCAQGTCAVLCTLCCGAADGE